MKITHAPKEAKKIQLERLLKNGTVMVMLDARRTGVQVPSEHMGNPQLALNFDFMYNIPDFKVQDDRIEATLEFGPMNFFCVLPFEAVYGYRPHSGDEVVVFPESVPKDLAPPPQATPLPSPTPLAVVESKGETEKKEEKKPEKKKGGELRIVK